MFLSFFILATIGIVIVASGIAVIFRSKKLSFSLQETTIMGIAPNQQSIRTAGTSLIVAGFLFAVFTLPGTRYGTSLQGSSEFNRFLKSGNTELARDAFYHWQIADDLNSFSKVVDTIPQDSPAWKYYISVSANYFFDKEDPQKYLDYLHSLSSKLLHPMGQSALHFELGNIYKQFDNEKALKHFRTVMDLKADGELLDRTRGNLHELENLNIGKAPPPFTLITIDGKKVSSNDLKGKIVLIDFWSVGCPPCLKQTDIKRDVYAKFQNEEFFMVSISLDDTKETRNYIKDKAMVWNHMLLGRGMPTHIIDVFNIQHVPAIYILDQNGRIAHKRIDAAQLPVVISALLHKTVTQFSTPLRGEKNKKP